MVAEQEAVIAVLDDRPGVRLDFVHDSKGLGDLTIERALLAVELAQVHGTFQECIVLPPNPSCAPMKLARGERGQCSGTGLQRDLM